MVHLFTVTYRKTKGKLKMLHVRIKVLLRKVDVLWALKSSCKHAAQGQLQATGRQFHHGCSVVASAVDCGAHHKMPMPFILMSLFFPRSMAI